MYNKGQSCKIVTCCLGGFVHFVTCYIFNVAFGCFSHFRSFMTVFEREVHEI